MYIIIYIQLIYYTIIFIIPIIIKRNMVHDSLKVKEGKGKVLIEKKDSIDDETSDEDVIIIKCKEH